jgi:hypothetical protein
MSRICGESRIDDGGMFVASQVVGIALEGIPPISHSIFDSSSLISLLPDHDL